MKRETLFWSCRENDESLMHTTMDAAIEDRIDELDALDGEIEVYWYAPLELPSIDFIACEILTTCLEWLDVEFGDPDDATADSEEMRSAAKALATVIRDGYGVFSHEVVKTVKVDVMTWVKEKRPDWLAEQEAGDDE